MKDELERMCKAVNINIPPNTNKHELVRLLCQQKGEAPPPTPILYNGNLSSLPSTLPSIRKLSVRSLWAILNIHGILICGNKDQIVIRVFLLKHSRLSAIFGREKQAFEDLIKLVEELIFVQLRQNIFCS